MPNDVFEIADNGKKLRLRLHPGQTRAWDSERRFVFVVAGTQSGKTSFGPHWLRREIERRGAGDYLAVTATFDLFKLKMLPELRHVFENILRTWTYHAADRVLYSNETISRRSKPTRAASRIILRSANSPAGLESATARAAWLDECGQNEFGLDAFEAVQRRLSLSEGRILGTTTPYNMGWLKQEVYDRWAAGDKDYQVIQFASVMNPSFPRAEFERARATMAPWKFSMFYRGQFSRPAGMIYDVFEDRHKIAPFAIPREWPRFGGLDFGGVNTAAVLLAKDPASGAFYLCSEYLAGGKFVSEHADDLKPWGARLWIGGSKSEGQWRSEFAKAGLAINPPSISAVEIGINRIYAAFKTDRLYVFDTCAGVLDQLGRYARELNAMDQPTDKIKDKDAYHYLDALRYIGAFLFGAVIEMPDEQPTQESKWTTPEDDIDGSRWRY